MERLTARTESGKAIYSAGVILNSKNYEHTILDRLAELEDKFESGQLIELPCKVGDTVYRWLYGSYDEWIVSKINTYKTQNEITYTIVAESEMCGTEYFELTDEGDTWFLTKTQAEAHLKELQESKN